MTTTPSIRSRLLTTPLRDLLRLRLTGRLAWRQAIRSSELPGEVQALIERVVRRTRLWRLERAGLAEELVSHFAGAIAAGAAVEAVVREFGEERTAARLIRRSQKRNRPWAWTALRVARWIVAAMVGYYGFLAIQFYTGQPKIAVDYLAAINRPIERTPVDQRGWPLYRQAMLQIGMPDPQFHDRTYSKPYDEQKLLAWSDAHAAALGLVRDAAGKPMLGFIVGPNGSQADPRLYPDLGENHQPHPMLIEVLAPYDRQLSELANLLGADAKSAAAHHDGARYAEDVIAQWHMGKQFTACPDQTLIHYLTGSRIRAMAIGEVDRILIQQPDLLDDAQLQNIARVVSVPQTASDIMSFDGERMVIDDIIQRLFTDDGKGSGHITAKVAGTVESPPVWLQIGTMAFSSRRAFEGVINRIFDPASAEIRRPLRYAEPHDADRLYRSLDASLSFHLRYGPLSDLIPRPELAAEAAERLLGHRDGVLVGMALERYRRRHGHYPATLAQLTPEFLPALPADRIAGDPVKYRLVNGKPSVYSIGVDRVDDGGKPATADRFGPRRPDGEAAAVWFPEGGTAPPRGDWILYPQSGFDKGN